MSCLVMRPPSPVPETCERLTPCSRAILRTSGEERASSSSADGCGGGALGGGATAAAAGFFSSFFSSLDGAGAGAAAFAGAASPSAAMVPTTVFTPTVVPSAILISCRTPEAGAGISASTLSVEISNSGSSRCTLSPGFFNHLVMVPSTMDSPIWGMMMSVGMISFHAAHDSERGSTQSNIIAGGGVGVERAGVYCVCPNTALQAWWQASVEKSLRRVHGSLRAPPCNPVQCRR